MQIVDRELDPADGPFRAAPDISAFRTAWIERQLPACALGRIFRALSIPFRRNFAPLAAAGRDQRVVRGSLVNLNGSQSCDPELGALTFRWRQIAGPHVALSSLVSATTTFRAPALTTRLFFRLAVSDGRFGDSDFVIVRVRP
jgi:hypothetical protein